MTEPANEPHDAASLNEFRDEAGAFLEAIGADGRGREEILPFLDEEMAELKRSLDNPARLQHQIYDVLFLLCELAWLGGSDLAGEWEKGRRHKFHKYLSDRGE